MLLGNTLIWFSLIMTALAMVLYLPGIRQGKRTPYLKQARWAVYAAALGMTAGLAYLWFLLLTHQFQFDYVYSYSGLDMQLRYVISALWGGQEGTFLLWAAFAGYLAVFLRFKAKAYEPAVQFFYMGITLFLLLMLTKASPFKLLDVVPADGRGLNPLLQDPWMTIHPPITFFGFASLGIPAAYAMAALIKEDWDAWIPRALPWTVFGVLSLGAGLTLGGYWSYSILGWGGYWGWDPVENSSLVPWLMGIALIHTQIIQLRQGRLRKINLLLSMMPFLFLTYSTFLTRSGVLADFSVHSFTDLGINQFLVAFMAVFLGGGLLLFLAKMSRVPVDKKSMDTWSREFSLVVGSILFAGFGLMVSLGTSAPLITRLYGPPSNVEPAFYNQIGLPFIIIVCLVMGIAPHMIWYRMTGGELFRRLRLPLLGTVIAAPLGYMGGVTQIPLLLMLLGGVFAFLGNLAVMIPMVRGRWMSMGGPLSHAGVGLMAMGILSSTAFDHQELVELPLGDEVAFQGYTLRYEGTRPVEEGRKLAYDVAVMKDGKSHIVSPTMYFADMSGMMRKPAIQSFLTHDVYIAPGGLEKESIAARTTSVLTLGKMETGVALSLPVRFVRYEMPGGESGGEAGAGHASSEGGEFRAVMEITVDGTTHELRPGVMSGPNGIRPGRRVSIPDSEYSMQLESIDATTGTVRVSVGHPPLVLDHHGTGELRGYKLHFEGFGIEEQGQRQATVTGAVRVTAPDGEVFEVTPAFIERTDEEREYVEVPLRDSGLNLVLAGVDTRTNQGVLYIARPPAETMWIEASIKPFIVLLWAGTIMVMFGMGLSTAYRGREQTLATVAAVPDEKERELGAA